MAARLFLLFVPLSIWSMPAPSEATEEASIPSKYTLDYPTVERFCAPIRTTFFEVTRQYSVVRGRRFRHAPNGGYGLPIVDKIGEKHLIHVGADLGWYQVGQPVYAVANGVVRVSLGPNGLPSAQPRKRPIRSFHWGNLIVIEHRTADDQFFTTIYGHLASKRLVNAGELVTAGQPIGTIGKQSPQINGGYKPHLHFGVREGRLGTIGMNLLPGVGKLTVESIDEDRIVLDFDKRWTYLTFNGDEFPVTYEGESASVPTRILWNFTHPDFPIVGYATTTDGFVDPVAFLRRNRADTAPAAYQR